MPTKMDATRDDMSDNSETAVGLTSWHGTADQCRWCLSSHRHWHGNAARNYLPWLVYMTLYVTFHLFFAMSTSFSHTHLGSELADLGSSSFVAVLRGDSVGRRMLNVTIEGQARSCLGLDSFPSQQEWRRPPRYLQTWAPEIHVRIAKRVTSAFACVTCPVHSFQPRIF